MDGDNNYSKNDKKRTSFKINEDFSSNSNNKEKKVLWDWKTIEEQEEERQKNPKKKINEPKTPYLPYVHFLNFINYRMKETMNI
jgi:hypothetical protein